MGGVGSGRKPDPFKQLMPKLTPIASRGGEGLFLPNHSGVSTHKEFKNNVLWELSGAEAILKTPYDINLRDKEISGAEKITFTNTFGAQALQPNKIKFFDDGGSNVYGMGVEAGSINFTVPNGGTFKFYDDTDLNVTLGTNSIMEGDLWLSGALTASGATIVNDGLTVKAGNGRIVQTGGGGAILVQTEAGTGGTIDFANNTAAIGISRDGVQGGYDYDGAFIFRQKGSNPDGDGEFIFIEEAGDWRFALPKSQSGYGTYNSRSMIIAGPSVNDERNFSGAYWGFNNIRLDTSGFGADLGVQNDIECLGDVYLTSGAVNVKGGTAHRTYYTDGSGNITELAHGTDGQVLTSTGATTAPAWEDPAVAPTPIWSETLTLDNTTGGNDARWSTDDKAEFRNASTFIHSPAGNELLISAANKVTVSDEFHVTGESFQPHAQTDVTASRNVSHTSGATVMYTYRYKNETGHPIIVLGSCKTGWTGADFRSRIDCYSGSNSGAMTLRMKSGHSFTASPVAINTAGDLHMPFNFVVDDGHWYEIIGVTNGSPTTPVPTIDAWNEVNF